MSDDHVLALQQALLGLGHDPGKLDGEYGPKTDGAMVRCRQARGPRRLRAAEPPWLTEGRAVLGLHEVRDRAALAAWLRSDGRTLGDPARLPWCGDFVETCIRRALPREPLPGALGDNPYWARNWALFGVTVAPTLGAVASFIREGGGHVGFLVAADPVSFHVLGGNQGDTVSVVRIGRMRLLATRWPATLPLPAIHLPVGPSTGSLSLNEA